MKLPSPLQHPFAHPAPSSFPSAAPPSGRVLITVLMAAALAGLVGLPLMAQAQVAGGTTTIGVSVIESTQLAKGWSAKKGILGKTVYNESGAKVGKVEDLIVSPDQSVSYLIIGAGGFIGIGRHDVAVPVSQVVGQNGRLVMAGATKDSVKAMPTFQYADDGARRAEFIKTTELALVKARADIAALQKKAAVATGEAKVLIDGQMVAMQAELRAAETKLSELKAASASRWKEFQAGVSDAGDRLRKSIDRALA